MFILAYAYHIKPGQTQEIPGLYKDWQQLLAQHGLVSAELLSDPHDPLQCVLLARFENEDAAWAAAELPAYRNWYARLANASESGPTVGQYVVEDRSRSVLSSRKRP